MPNLMDQLRREVELSNESPYAIARGSGVDKSQLSRILNDPARCLSIPNAERLADYLGFEIVLRRKARARKVK